MYIYKNNTSDYENFYKNDSGHQLFHNIKKESQKGESQEEDCQKITHYIDQIIQAVLSENNEALTYIKLLTDEIQHPKNHFDDVIKDKDFLGFLFHILAETPQPRSIRFKLIKLLYNMIDSYESLHSIVIDIGFLPFLFHAIVDVNNEIDCPRKSIFELIIAENEIFSTVFYALKVLMSLYYSNESLFCDFVSYSKLDEAYFFISESLNKEFPKEIISDKKWKKEILRRIEIHSQIQKGIVVLLSQFSQFQLSFEDMMCVYKIVHYNLISLNHELPITDTIQQFSLIILSNMIEKGSIDANFYPEFHDCDLFPVLINQIQTTSSTNKIIRTCDIFVALFENHYFEYYPFIYTVNEILDFIDYANDHDDKLTSAYLRLLASMIKNDKAEFGGFVYECLHSEQKNEKGFRTICFHTQHGNFDSMISAAHCFIDLFEKTPPDNQREYLEKCTFEALHSIIQTGVDSDKPELILKGLQILLHILTLCQRLSSEDHLKAIEMVMEVDLPTLLVEDLSAFDDEPIVFLVDQINEIINEGME